MKAAAVKACFHGGNKINFQKHGRAKYATEIAFRDDAGVCAQGHADLAADRDDHSLRAGVRDVRGLSELCGARSQRAHRARLLQRAGDRVFPV